MQTLGCAHCKARLSLFCKQAKFTQLRSFRLFPVIAIPATANCRSDSAVTANTTEQVPKLIACADSRCLWIISLRAGYFAAIQNLLVLEDGGW